MTVHNLLANMEQKELCYWIAYHKIENSKDKDQKPKENNDGVLLTQLLKLSAKK